MATRSFALCCLLLLSSACAATAEERRDQVLNGTLAIALGTAWLLAYCGRLRAPLHRYLAKRLGL